MEDVPEQKDLASVEGSDRKSLRDAWAERANNMSKASRAFADRWSMLTQPTKFTGIRMLDNAAQLAGVDAFWLPAKAVEVSSAYIRDRLQTTKPAGNDK